MNPKIVCNLPLSVSMLQDCLTYTHVSFPYISKYLWSKNIFQKRFVCESLALSYLRNLFSSSHIVSSAGDVIDSTGEFYPEPRGPRVLPMCELVLWYGMFAPCGRFLGTMGFAHGAPSLHQQRKQCVRKKRDSGDRKEPAIHEQTSFGKYFRSEVLGDIRKRNMSIGEAVLEHGYT